MTPSVTPTAATGTASRVPLHVSAELLASKKVGAYRHLTFVAPGIPEQFRPGTFVAVSIGAPGTDSRLARRSFWIHRVKPVGGYGATIEIVLEPLGIGSEWLAALAPGARVAMTGPLGRPFALPQEPVACLLIGEGYAAASMFPLAERLRERGCAVTLVVAGADEGHLLSALEARRSARAVTVVTEDGSVGRRGVVADVLDDVLTQSGAEVVYAAGPVPTLHAVAAAAERHGAWSQTAVEQVQPCGTGLCQGCPVPVVGQAGAAQLARACVDGPVFRGDKVRWDDLEAM